MNSTSVTVQNIVISLRKEINNGILKPGAHLTETSVSKDFKVSRVPVREAFRILQTEGYIDLIHNRGGFVKKISRENIMEVADIYYHIAPLILSKAIPRYNKNTYKKANAILSKIENCTKYCESSYLDWEFGKVITSPSKMELSIKIIDDIYSQCLRVLNKFFESEKNTKFKIDVHRRFLALCEDNKQDEAIKLWVEHISNMKELLLEGKLD